MRGLIYKEICLFFKSMDKRLLLVEGACIIIIMAKAGIYAGLIASVMLSMAMGVQSVLSLDIDEKCNWKKYQMAMPVSNYGVIASKYISIVYILVPSVLASIIFNLISSMIYGNWVITLYGLSIVVAILLPLVWTAICLPLSYWFGFRASQVMAIICVFPVVRIINFFEDGPGVAALPDTMTAYLIVAFIICAALFVISYFLSVVGYSRKK